MEEFHVLHAQTDPRVSTQPGERSPGVRTACLMGMAFKDELTGLFNARYLKLQLARYAAGERPAPLTVLFVDLDGFKEINDTFGHAVGDRVLQEIAWMIREAVGLAGCAFRVGGDEFIALIGGGEAVLARRILRTIARSLVRYKGALPMARASVGVARFPQEGSCLEAVIELADRRMYERKRSPR